MTEGPTSSELLKAAATYADLGYAVFPCEPGGKRPLTQHGCKDATTDIDQIEKWWTEWPTANVGIATDGLIVVDLDPVDGERNTFADVDDRLDDLLVCVGAKTPRHGNHFYFRQPDDGDYRNTAGKIARGVDTRANGGYVLASPSATEHGRYEWLRGFELDRSPDRLPLPPLFILERLHVAEVVRVEIGEDAAIPDGQRNSTLTSIGGTLRRNGLSENAIAAALQTINLERCNPPLTHDEVKKIAWSVSRYEPDQLSQAVAEGWSTAGQDQERFHDTVKDPGPLPIELLNPGGLIGDVLIWNVTTAYRPQKELALGGALALMSVLAGRKIQTEDGIRGNLYCLSIGESAGGKEWARKVNRAILTSVGMTANIGAEEIGSAQGLIATLQIEPVQLFQLDEFGRMLRTLQNPTKAPHLYNIVTTLLKLFTAADSVYKGGITAASKGVAPEVNQPHCVLYCTTTPDAFYDSLTADSVRDGFVGRLLVFESTDKYPDPNEACGLGEVPGDIVERAAWWAEYTPGGNLGGVFPQPRAVYYHDDAKAVFRELDLMVRAHLRSGRPNAAIWGRAVEKAKKLAMLHAVSLNATECVIGDESARWGCWLADYLSQRLEWLAQERTSETHHEGLLKRMLRIVREAGEGGISLTALARRFQGIPARQRDDLIRQLQETGLATINRTETGSRGRPSTTVCATETA